jgi:uncharacterized BrkB/YihY/UPF0761 family membrane protein
MVRDRLVEIATRLVGFPRVAAARRVLDRFNAADGGLLAAGVAYNVVLALIPLGLLATGFAGFVLNDAASRADMIRSISSIVPPLAGVVDEIVGGLSKASPSVSIVGLVLAAWGTSRLFAALESAIVQMDAGAPRRSIFRQTARRLGSIVVLAGIVLAALVVTPALAIGAEMSGVGPARPVLDLLLAILPPVLGGIALAVAIVLLTRLFVFVAPRVFGANLVYGTLGAILIGLTWLDLVFTVVLLGAAWVRERMASAEAAVV